MIDSNTHIYNRFGFISYLREDRNIYFLTQSITAQGGSFLLEYYTENPLISSGETYDSLIETLSSENVPALLETLCSSKDKLVDSLIKALPLDVQQQLLESAVESDDKGIKVRTNLRKRLLTYFENYIKSPEVFGIDSASGISTNVNKTISSFNDKLRCYDSENGWANCPEELEQIVHKAGEEKMELIDANPLGYYGLVNPDSKDFCIKETSKTEKQRLNREDREKIAAGKKPLSQTDKRRRAKGVRCSSLGDKVYDIQKDALKLGLYSKAEQGRNPDMVCKRLKNAMEQKGWVVEDKSCGTSKKRS